MQFFCGSIPFPAMVQFLLAHPEMDINLRESRIHILHYPPLPHAVFAGSSAIVKLLLERHDIDVNAVPKDGMDFTALIIAVALAVHMNYDVYDEITKMLLNHKNINVNYQMESANKHTALMEAAVRGNVKAVIRLLDRDEIKVGLQNSDGKNALLLAKEKGHERIVELLENHMEKKAAQQV